MRWPLDPHWSISSPFGMRLHPVLHIRKLHAGADFIRAGGASTGAKLHAIADGRVTARLTVAQCPGGGNFLEIRHRDGTFGRYFHMQSASDLHKGDEVAEGDLVGRLGDSGSWSTGPHLHFELLTKHRKPVDPVAYIQHRLGAHPAAIASPVHHETAFDEEEDEMKTIQIHYVADDGKVIRALITPGTAYFAPWQESGGAIANGLAKALATGGSVAVTKKMYDMLKATAAKLEPKDIDLAAIPVSNVDGPILEDPDAFPLGPDGVPLDPIDIDPIDLGPIDLGAAGGPDADGPNP